MMKYIKKPVVIEAVVWTGDNLVEIMQLTGFKESSMKQTWEEYEKSVRDLGLKIFTIDEPVNAVIGDYIIKEANGYCYPCNAETFCATYIKASE